MFDTITVGICDDHALMRFGSSARHRGRGSPGSHGRGRKRRRSARPRAGTQAGRPPSRRNDAGPQRNRCAAAAPRRGPRHEAVLVLSMQDDPAYIRAAFASGARGYSLKDAATIADLAKALHEVVNGRRYVHPALRARIVSMELRTAPDPDRSSVRARARGSGRLLALGHTNQEIAKMLFISVRTAESHRARIGEKLGLRTRAGTRPVRAGHGNARHARAPSHA